MKEGDYIIVELWAGSYDAYGPVTKVTEKQVRYRGWRDENRCARSQVRFAGPEADVRRLVEKLTSSSALMREEKRAAGERHERRVAGLLDTAEGGQ